MLSLTGTMDINQEFTDIVIQKVQIKLKQDKWRKYLSFTYDIFHRNIFMSNLATLSFLAFSNGSVERTHLPLPVQPSSLLSWLTLIV